MRKILIIALVSASLFAQSAKELYDMAQEFESKGDTANAMKFYKLSAERSFIKANGEQLEKSIIAPSQTIADAATEERKIAATNEPLKIYESEAPYNIDEILGIKMHHLNYLLPATAEFKDIEGRKKFETNFQLSIQKPLFHDIFDMNETISFGYSQSSWWQTAKSSTPFRETNYRPEIFVTFPTKFAFLPQLDYVRAGLLHESNGQGGEKSRSWNRVYASAKFYVGNFIIIPRAWVRLPDPDGKDDNPGITKYIGVADMNVAFPYRRHILTLMLRNNLRLDTTNKGAAEFGWLFPFGNSGVYGYVKYFTGYGESLIDYNRHTNKVGIGFALLK